MSLINVAFFRIEASKSTGRSGRLGSLIGSGRKGRFESLMGSSGQWANGHQHHSH